MKKQRLLITELSVCGSNRRISAVVDGFLLLEAHPDREESEICIGDIYIGRVQKVVPGIGAAFVEITPGRACYLPLEHAKDAFYVKKLPSDRLVQGDELLVQIDRDAVKTKPPTLSANLNLSGRYVVLTMTERKIGISNKLSKADRDRFHALLDAQTVTPFGIIVRTNAAAAQDAEILSEIRLLSERMEQLKRIAGMRTCFSRLHRAQPAHLRCITGCRGEIAEIVTDLPEVFEELKSCCASYPELQTLPCRLYEDRLQPLSKLYNLERQLERALMPRVWLKSGGYLVIEPTEALTVIDVNTGKSTGSRDRKKHYVKTNLEAAAEIALQLRLRNLSGIIIIDFIDMSTDEERSQILAALRNALKTDPVPVHVVDITRLDLVELTRKKVEKSLAEQLTS